MQDLSTGLLRPELELVELSSKPGVGFEWTNRLT